MHLSVGEIQMMSLSFPVEHALREWGGLPTARTLFEKMNKFMYHA